MKVNDLIKSLRDMGISEDQIRKTVKQLEKYGNDGYEFSIRTVEGGIA